MPGEQAVVNSEPAAVERVAPRATRVLVRRFLFALAPLLVFLVFFTQDRRVRLWDPDESYYARAAREMAERHEYMAVVFNGERFYHKPAFFYWLVLLCQWIGGVTEHAIRFTSALAATGCVIIVFLWARRGRGDAAGLAAALIASTCVELFVFSRIATPDMTLTFFILACLYGFLLHMEYPGRPRALLLAWAAAGLGFSTKGPVGVALPVLCAASYLLVTRRLRQIRSLFRPLPLLMFLLCAVPWYAYMAVRHPDYVRAFFLEHNIQRFLSPIHHHDYPFWFFLPVFIGGLFPWLFHLLSEVRAGLRERERLFALTSAVVIILVFTPSESKLPGYILASFPLAAVVAAPAVLSGGLRGLIMNVLPALQIVLIVAATQTAAFARQLPLFTDPAYPGPLIILTVLLAAAVSCMLLPKRAWAQVAAGAVAVVLYISTLNGLEPYKPAEMILRDVAERGSPPFATLQLQRRQEPFLPSLVYYNGANITELHDRTELTSFLKRSERVLIVLNDEDFRQIPWVERWVPVHRIADYTDINFRAAMISNRPDGSR
ncbi:MAG: glycosyltransferase family 39 protein [Acidobacteriota bacterium]